MWRSSSIRLAFAVTSQGLCYGGRAHLADRSTRVHVVVTLYTSRAPGPPDLLSASRVELPAGQASLQKEAPMALSTPEPEQAPL